MRVLTEIRVSPDPQSHRLRSIYSPVVDPSFRPLPLDLSETASQLEDPKQSLQDKVSDFLARLHQDSINLSLDIPKPRPFPGKNPERYVMTCDYILLFVRRNSASEPQ